MCAALHADVPAPPAPASSSRRPADVAAVYVRWGSADLQDFDGPSAQEPFAVDTWLRSAAEALSWGGPPGGGGSSIGGADSDSGEQQRQRKED